MFLSLKRKRCYVKTHRAFTIIETVVSIGILLFIGAGVIAFQRTVIVNAKTLQSALITQSQVRKVLTMFVSEMRSASPSASGGYAIAQAATSSVVFYGNVDSDTDIERVRYFLGTSTYTGQLRRGVINPLGTTYTGVEAITTVARDVVNPTSTPVFLFYDGSYDGVTASSTAPLPEPINVPLVRLIKMVLVLNPNGVRAPVMQTYTTAVTLRYLKDNL